MKFLSIGLFKINIEFGTSISIDPKEFGNDLDEYLKDLVNLTITNSGGRQFKFDRATLEIPTLINQIVNGQNFSTVGSGIAERLLKVETEAQTKMDKLGVQIQKGILVLVHLEIDGEERIVFCKADDTEYLNEQDFKKARGLPIEKKIFKAFDCKIDNAKNISAVKVLDTFPRMSKYWWSTFLELTEVYDDIYNTKNAFQAIDVDIFNKIKKKYPQDHTHLRNSAVRYFRAAESFEMEDFIKNAIGDYSPIDTSLKMDDVKKEIRDLPTKRKFDPQFDIVKSEITARFKSNISLTPQIDLIIKEDIDLKGTITTEEGKDGKKYVKIRSESGYDYFKDKL